MLIFPLSAASLAGAQESPYFITEHHHLPEAGALGFANYSVVGVPKEGNGFLGSQMELEYRATKWWATTMELHGQSTLRDSTILTGYAWTNKVKLLPEGHFLNPVFVFTWEDVNAAEKSIAEIEGHASRNQFAASNAVARLNQEHEIEMKLILSRDHRGWNFAGNVLAAKNLSGEPWQFGYSLAVSRPLSTTESNKACNRCRRALSAGLELYGGVGDASSLGLSQTAQYLGPAVSWSLANGVSLKASPSFGLTPASQRAFIHCAVIYDIADFKRRVRELFR